MSDVIKFKHSKYWYARFMVDGQIYQKTTKSTNKRAAEQIAAKYRQDVLEGIYDIAEQTTTIQEAFDLYRNSKPATNRPFHNGVKFVANLLNEHIISTSEPLISLSSSHLQQLYNHRMSNGCAPGTVKLDVGTVMRMITFCKRNGYKVSELEPPVIKVKNDKLRYFTKQEEERILEELDPKKPMSNLPSYEDEPNSTRRLEMQDNYDLFVLLLDIGCRLRECASLNWNDIDLKNSTIHLYRSKVKNEDIIHMTSRVKEILTRRYKVRKGQWVFTGRDETQKKTFSGIRKAIKRAGCTDATIHTARHTYATKLVQAGVSLYEVSHMLGHSNLQMTQRYSHLNKQDVSRRVAQVIDSSTNNAGSTYNLTESCTNSYTDISTAISVFSQKSSSILDTINAGNTKKDKEIISI